MTENQELLAKLQAKLKEQGVAATEAQISAAIDMLQKDELVEQDLEEVAGGRMVISPLMPLSMLLAICPRCHAIYIRKNGHRCRYSGGHSGGGRHG